MKRSWLHKTKQTVSSFRLEGQLSGCEVSAVWDGSALLAAAPLLQLAELAEEVDAVFVAAGLEAKRSCCRIGGSPERALLTLMRLCDDLQSVEFADDNGVHRVL